MHNDLTNKQTSLCGWLAGLTIVLVVIRTIVAGWSFTPTVDEPYHIGSAAAFWARGDHTQGVQHPPVSRIVAGLPLWWNGAAKNQHLPPTIRKEDAAYALGAKVLYEDTDAAGTTFRGVLNSTRAAESVFVVVMLIYSFLLGRIIGGPLGGLVVVAALACDATLAGHAMWVGTDVAAAAGSVAIVYHAWRLRERMDWASAVQLGCALGLGIGCKFTVVIVAVPVCAVTVWGRDWRARLATMGTAIGVGVLVLWATYGFAVRPMGDSDVLGNHPIWMRVPAWIKNMPVPAPSLWLGLVRLLGHSAEGHTAYLNGHLSQTGWWYYFPELMLLKTPVGLVVWAMMGWSILVWKRARVGRQLLWMCVLATGLFWLASVRGNIQIGVRHLLPVIPLMIVLAAAGWMRVGPSRRGGVLSAVLLLLAALELHWRHPDYLSFFNVAVGGPANGSLYAADSNLDWGQDVGRMADYFSRAGIRSAARPGSGYALRLLNTRQEGLIRQLGTLDPAALDGEVVRGQPLIISTSRRLLEGDKAPWAAAISGRKPDSRIGFGFEIYNGPWRATSGDGVR